MKKLLVPIALCALLATEAQAQVKASKGGKGVSENSVTYALPRTVVNVRVVAEKESVRVGPYARFAQKFLGVIAPLADKDTYTIKSAVLSAAQEADPAEVYVLENPGQSPVKLYEGSVEGLLAAAPDGACAQPSAFAAAAPQCPGGATIEPVSYTSSDTSFLRVPVDRQSTIVRSPEAMASDAANTIFSLRKHRIDLVTGEAGENVFGEGLKAALEEIDRLEQEYMALFLGKQFRQTIVREYGVVPSKEENNVIAFRFSEAGGLLSPGDLTGRPVLLEITPENKAQSSALLNKSTKGAKGTVFYRIADVAGCRLMDGNREIAQARLPIFQLGPTVEIPVAAVK